MKPTLKSGPVRKATDWLMIAEHLLRAGFVALLFLAVLVPSDTPSDNGMFVSQSAVWCFLAMGVSLWLVFPRRPMELGIVDWLAGSYLLWTAAATFAVWGVGDLRAAINSFFQSAAFVLAILLGRQLLSSNEQRRIVLTAMLALGAAMALLGVLQFFIFGPANREQIQSYPELLLEPLGIFDHNSPEAQRALDRALSPEPLGTFTLTNSLACFLAPWIIVLVARWLDFQSAREEKTKLRWHNVLWQAGSLPHVLLLAVCLWLTHSRMSILAMLAGLALLASLWLRSRGMRRLAIGVPLILVAAAIAVAVVMLSGESSALAAATTSARYRFEYWQSTSAMIGDHWLFGVGPGNFKSVYPHYKLPQASEEIGDPHNFILEVWSTAGTPAVLLLGALLAAVFWRKVARDQRAATNEVTDPTSPTELDPANDDGAKQAAQYSISVAKLWTLGGAASAFLILAIVGPLYSPAYLWILAAAAALFFFALQPLVTDDLLHTALPIAAVTMLINLLAAGGIGFPNVAIPLATLLAFISPRVGPSEHLAQSHSLPASSTSHFARSVFSVFALVGTIVLYVSCYFLSYLPVMRADTVELELRMNADPFSPEVCRQVARSELQLIESGSPQRLEAMEGALDEAIGRDPRSHVSRIWAGDARLRAFRVLQRRELLEEAIEDYAQAAERYPNWSFTHAQLAWARHIAGDNAGAAAAAQVALRLDDLCPHEDRKLRRQTLHDTVLTPLRILPLDAAMRRLAQDSDSDR